MCGMELLPYIKEYKRRKGKVKQVIRPKAYCDNLCRAHFMRRVFADEMGWKIGE